MRRLSILLVLLTLLVISMQGKKTSLKVEIRIDEDEDDDLGLEIEEDEIKEKFNEVITGEDRNLFQMINEEESALDIVNFLARYNVTIKKLFIIRDWEGIKTRSKLPRVKEYINDKVNTFYKMNVGVAFQLLGNVGKLLRVAYAGCKGYSCSTDVLAVLSHYQTLISSSKVLSSYFVNVVIRALKYHRYAYYHAEKNKFSSSLRQLKRSIPLAEIISEKAKYIVEKATFVTSMSEQALFEASRNEVGTIEDRKNVEMRLRNISAASKRLSAETKLMEKARANLKIKINEMKIDISTLSKKEDREKQISVILNKCKLVEEKTLILCGGLARCKQKAVTRSMEICNNEVDQTLADIKNKNLERIARKTENIRKQRLELIKSKLKVEMSSASVYGKLEESVHRLKTFKSKRNDLKKAITSLEISVRALAIVKTVFLKAVEFWDSVVKHTATLGSEAGQDADFQQTDKEKEKYKEMILQSGLTWLALGKVQEEAATAMIQTSAIVDETLMILPSFQQVSHIIDVEAELLIAHTYTLSKRLNEGIIETKTEMQKMESLGSFRNNKNGTSYN